MKFILSTLLAFSCLVVSAQNLDRAVFKECLSSPDPKLCTQQKFEEDINHLLTYDISEEIKKSLDKNYFSVSIIFVTDENGKIIPEITDIRCDYPSFKQAIEKYLNTLPALQPKNSSHEEKRTLHSLHYTFMMDYVIKKYASVDKIRLEVEKIHPKYFMGEFPPVYPGCKCKKKDREILTNKCSNKKVMKFITKNFKIPPTNENPRSVRIMTSYIVERDGTITIDKITSPEEELNKEMERIIKMLPKFEPGKMKGFPVRATYTLPVTVTFR